jgi:O-acetylserine/cysteine efflux transporter
MTNNNHRTAIFALVAAGVIWGSSVALSKLSLSWLGPGWLTVARFLVAAPVLAVVGRRGLRDALKWEVVGSGALGFGVVIILQNAGIDQTSVSHAAVLVGLVPVLVAVMAMALRDGRPDGRSWLGYAVAVIGIAFVARGGGGGASAGGDVLVIASVVLSAAFIVLQPRVLVGRDAAAVTAVQFAAGALLALPLAIAGSGMPHAPHHAGPVIAFAVLALAATVLPFWLFAYGQTRVSARLAGVFVNLEPLVGAAIGWIAFGDPVGLPQFAGALAVMVGIALSAGTRTPPMLAPLVRAWEQGVLVHEKALAANRPWELEGPLQWRKSVEGERLIGSFAPPTDPHMVMAQAPMPDGLVDS